MSEQKSNWILGGIVALALLVFFFKDKLFPSNTNPSQGTEPENAPDVLQLGSKGELVKLLQQRLNSIIAAHLAVGSVYVAQIDDEIFEIRTTLVPDGKFGDKTLKALIAVTSKPFMLISDLDKLLDKIYMPDGD